MKAPEILHLSQRFQPVVCMGGFKLSPQNLRPGPDRAEYVDGLLAYFDSYLRFMQSGRPSDAVADEIVRHINHFPFAREILDFDVRNGRIVLRSGPETVDQVHFDRGRITLAFVDGMDRRESRVFKVTTGDWTPEASRIISRLSAGVSARELARLSRGGGRGARLIRQLKDRGMIVPKRPVAAHPASREDRVTWLGHAFAAFSTGSTNVWIDPVLFPKFKWTADDRACRFSPEFGESAVFARYDTDVQPLALSELPPPDAVCITHQDTDHFDLGTLMRIPREVPIIVPFASGKNPWEVRLADVLASVLGRGRKVIMLRHGESVRIGETRITAVPFQGEMPASLEHQWNCYVVQSVRSAAVFLADSALTEKNLDAVADAVGPRKTAVLFSQRPADEPMPRAGYLDEKFTRIWYVERLWPWYLRPVDLLRPMTDAPSIPAKLLARLSRRIRLRGFFPYACGTAPWYRMAGTSPYSLDVRCYEREDFRQIGRLLSRAVPRVELLGLRYGEPSAISGPKGRS